MSSSSGVAGPPAPVRVLLVDGHAAIRDALATVLTMEPGIAVVGAAGGIEAAVALIRHQRPHVALVGLNVLDRRDWAGLRELIAARPRMAVLVMGVIDSPATARSAARHGAAGRLLKDAPAHEIVTAIRRAAKPSGRLRLLPPGA